MTNAELRRVAESAIDSALNFAKAGNVGETSNNQGSWVRFFRRTDGTGKRVWGRGNWCAAFASSCLVLAAKKHGLDLSFKTSRGARRLVKNTDRVAMWTGAEGDALAFMLALGNKFGLISWKRRGWRGHVGFWYRYDAATDTLYTVEGNHRRKGNQLAYVDTFRYPHGSWRKRLDRIVSF